MTGPRPPRPGRPDPGDPVGPAPGPRPGPGPGPFRPPIPWTPFGPGDTAAPDTPGILARVAKTRTALEAAQVKLTRLRHGPGPDGTDPRVRPVSRADGLWPFLVIRSYLGDVGARPIDTPSAPEIGHGEFGSPDIVVTTIDPTDKQVLGRDGVAALHSQNRIRKVMNYDTTYTIWVHVWNLGLAPAHGVRVRAWGFANAPDGSFTNSPPKVFLGGTEIDLGDRTSEDAHLLVRTGTWLVPAALGPRWGGGIQVVAESMSDVMEPANPLVDRHAAFIAIPFM